MIHVYCDESCHLEEDGLPCMVLGAVYCQASYVATAHNRIREIVAEAGLPRHQEVKWTKVSRSNVELYKALLDYFFSADELAFRCVVAAKSELRHAEFTQSHDAWYYKMYYLMLNWIVSPKETYRFFLDYKDTQGALKTRTLMNALRAKHHDFDYAILNNIQVLRSHELPLMQLADVLIGAIGYANRGLRSSESKLNLVAKLKELSGYSLLKTTLLREAKFNIFHWDGQ